MKKIAAMFLGLSLMLATTSLFGFQDAPPPKKTPNAPKKREAAPKKKAKQTKPTR